jgi:RNA-directed DNA polymerase
LQGAVGGRHRTQCRRVPGGAWTRGSSGENEADRHRGGFDFLGQNIRKYNGKLLIKPSPKSVKAFLDKVRAIIKANPTASAGHLILQLNPIIRGWVNYHRHVVSKKVFQKIDHEVVMALWRWAKRRHRNKSRRWIKAKYFGRSWVFHGQVKGKEGTKRSITLFRAAKEPIRRHVKVRAEANPYDPEWEQYFEARLQRKMSHRLKGKRTMLQLWLSQQGRCPVCAQTLTQETDWDCHHVVPRVFGGADTIDNLALLHPTCHTQVHSLGETVLSPRPTTGR